MGQGEQSFYLAHGKRWFDAAVAASGLAVLLVPMAVVSLAIRLTDGSPTLFRQIRVGRHGRPFRVCKFRTMRRGAAAQGTVTVRGDTRVTPIGRWLRRFKVDELPQLWNVLLGHMSFVGPRPDVPGYADRLTSGDARLVELRPGITGLATLVFRDEEELLARASDPRRFNDEELFPAKVRLNLQYAREASLLRDMALIVLTLTGARVAHPERERLEALLANEKGAGK